MVCNLNNFNTVLTLRSMIFDRHLFNDDNSLFVNRRTKMTIAKVANKVHELKVLLSRGSFRGARPLFRFLSFFLLNERELGVVFNNKDVTF